MLGLKNIAALPPRALGFGLWWMWIYLALLSPTFAQSPFVAHPVDGAMLSFGTVISGAVVYAVAVPLAWKIPGLFERRALALGAGALTSASTAAMAFSSFFGDAGSAVFVGGSLVAGVGISVVYLQWGAYYASLEPRVVTPCTVLAFLLAIVLSALMLDHGLLTSVVIIALPLAAAALAPVGDGLRADAGSGNELRGRGAPKAESLPSLRQGLRRMFPLSVIALILAFSFAFGLFRVLLSSGSPSGRDFDMLLLCSAAMAFVMLIIIMAFSVSLGWDSIIYLTLPLIAVAALVLSIMDFGDRQFVWAIIVAAVRVSDLILWMVFANLARASRSHPVTVFAVGKLTGQIGVIAGILIGNFLVRAFNVESLLLPTALIFLVLVTLFGSIAAIRGRIAAGATLGGQGAGAPESQVAVGSGLTAPLGDAAPMLGTPLPPLPGEGLASRADGEAPFSSGSGSGSGFGSGSGSDAAAGDASIAAIAREHGLSPRETEIFELLARGRTIPYIADELVLANSTVTTHVRGLYRKLDVHNRQELLDLVEQRR